MAHLLQFENGDYKCKESLGQISTSKFGSLMLAEEDMQK